MVASRNSVYDFIDRTKRNLKKIDDSVQEDPHSFFEVTQLINSAVGLLMFPGEDYLNSLPDLPLENFLEAKHMPRVLYGNYNFGSLADAVKKIRNSIAHYNVEFVNYNNEIKGLYLWNMPHPDAKKPDLVIYLSVASLKEIFKEATRAYLKISQVNSAEFERNRRLSLIEEVLGKELRITNPSSY